MDNPVEHEMEAKGMWAFMRLDEGCLSCGPFVGLHHVHEGPTIQGAPKEAIS